MGSGRGFHLFKGAADAPPPRIPTPTEVEGWARQRAADIEAARAAAGAKGERDEVRLPLPGGVLRVPPYFGHLLEPPAEAETRKCWVATITGIDALTGWLARCWWSRVSGGDDQYILPTNRDARVGPQTIVEIGRDWFEVAVRVRNRAYVRVSRVEAAALWGQVFRTYDEAVLPGRDDRAHLREAARMALEQLTIAEIRIVVHELHPALLTEPEQVTAAIDQAVEDAAVELDRFEVEALEQTMARFKRLDLD